MLKLVFIRHGLSEWNALNQFTGWVDVDLSEKGVEEAKEAGRKVKEAGIEFDMAFTSVLKRAIKTCNYVLEESDQLWVPQTKSSSNKIMALKRTSLWCITRIKQKRNC